MAQQTDAQLSTQADVIRNEVAKGANTKGRVADMFQNLNDSKINNLLQTNRKTDDYTLVISDAGKMVEMNKATSNSLTIPPNSAVPFDNHTQILITQYGAGQTAIVGGSGVTIRSKDGNLKLSGQYYAATLIKIGADEWYLIGDLTA